MRKISRAEIAAFFCRRGTSSSFLDRLKIRYRPYICPFEQLLEYAIGKEGVLDIGCGSGQLCLLLCEFTDAQRIHGIEIDERLIRNALAEIPVRGSDGQTKSVEFSLFDGSTIPDMVMSFDLVYMIDVLHHIPEKSQEQFLRNVFAAMRPDATLILKDIDASSLFVVANKIHDLLLSGSVGHEWTLDRARNFCELLGFVVEEARRQLVGVYPHYFLRLRKPAAGN